METEPLFGGRTTTGVLRIADTVRRPIFRDAGFAHSCLLHLEQMGFCQAPRFLGIDDLGREMLSFLPGDAPADLGNYTDVQLIDAAALLRRFHDVTETMPAVREQGYEVACHNDWAPTNTVFSNGRPVAMIDFDTVAPGERLWDLGYSAFTWLDLGNDDFSSEEQIRRLGVFAGGYGHPACTTWRIAVYAVARQSALAASTQARGQLAVSEWASRSANWTALNITERLLPSGHPHHENNPTAA